MDAYTFRAGDSPLLVSIPHAGTDVAAEIAARLSPAARPLPDTDWHVDRLYDFLGEIGAGVLCATHARYVIDLNRPPDDAALYATRTTGLLPGETFDGQPVYRAGEEPGPAEATERVERYWRPFHEALAEELERLREAHGFALLLDAHSIRSRLPALFEGRLPDFNLGSDSGRSAGAGLAAAAMAVLESDGRWSSVRDGRFKGGYITRHYGQPDRGFHALQLELAQSAYMQERPPRAGPRSMRSIREVLQRLLQTLLAWKPAQ